MRQLVTSSKGLNYVPIGYHLQLSFHHDFSKVLNQNQVSKVLNQNCESNFYTKFFLEFSIDSFRLAGSFAKRRSHIIVESERERKSEGVTEE